MHSYRQSARLLVALSASLCLSSCGGNVIVAVGPTTPTPPVPGYSYLTGNWQMNVTSSMGRPSFTALAGFIDETTNKTGTSDATNAVLQLTPDSCFVGGTTLPLTGTVTAGVVSLRSFSNTGQFVTIDGNEDAMATSFTGTFTIGGGCSNGASGTITGVRFDALTGTYTGSFTTAPASPGIVLIVQQSAFGDGRGFSPVTGNATFSGIPCFTNATLTAAGSAVIGSAVQLTFAASDGETVLLSGTMDPLASTVTLTTGQISGGSCSGALGAATLARS